MGWVTESRAARAAADFQFHRFSKASGSQQGGETPEGCVLIHRPLSHSGSFNLCYCVHMAATLLVHWTSIRSESTQNLMAPSQTSVVSNPAQTLETFTFMGP